MTQSEWFELIRAGSPVLAAVLAGGVAWRFGTIQTRIAEQQAVTAKNKLKLDLFERRWNIYEVASNAIKHALENEGLGNEESYKYYAGIQGARWIMDEAVEDYLQNTLTTKFQDYELACINFKTVHQTKEREQLNAARLSARKQLFSQFQEIDKVFDEHLQLKS